MWKCIFNACGATAATFRKVIISYCLIFIYIFYLALVLTHYGCFFMNNVSTMHPKLLWPEQDCNVNVAWCMENEHLLHIIVQFITYSEMRFLFFGKGLISMITQPLPSLRMMWFNQDFVSSLPWSYEAHLYYHALSTAMCRNFHNYHSALDWSPLKLRIKVISS